MSKVIHQVKKKQTIKAKKKQRKDIKYSESVYSDKIIENIIIIRSFIISIT